MAKRICRSCGEIIEKTESSWVHRYNRPMSLVIPCRKIDPSPEGLEEICINLVTEAEITDAGQRDIEQYIKQIKEKLIERGVEWMPLYENEEVD